jgi:serine/threonine-protein kinase
MSAGGTPPTDSVALAREIDALCDRFEDALFRGETANLAGWLPTTEPLRGAALVELARIELEYRLRAGETVRVEEYFARYPELAADAAKAKKMRAAEEYGGRGVMGQEPTPFRLGPAEVPGGEHAAAGHTGPAEKPAIPGYEVLEELGRGGMGVVYLARDPELNRAVAVKVMHPEHRQSDELRRRFVEEARVASQLQHPGLPPVHELGALPGVGPYIVMKVIKGRTLADLLRDHPGLPGLLAIFGQVCQALAYVHSKGVIHRDLKPLNVMVGAFGEVQVMDWGLAKVLTDTANPERQAREDTPAATSVVETLRSAGAGTHAGLPLGTFAYMPPEQARGEIEQQDRRSDVFGLGAILCEILTGLPPYVGTPMAVKAQAQLGHLDPAGERLKGCGADDELVEIARSCLRPCPDERPVDAGAVALAVASYQAGVQERLRQTELEWTAARVRAEEETRTRRVAEAKAAVERRARRLTVVLAAAGLVLVTAVGGGTWWLRQRQKATDQGVAELIAEARLLHDQAHGAPLSEVHKFDQAAETAQKAERLARSGGSSAELQQLATDLARDLLTEAEAAQRDQRLVTALLEVRGPHEGPEFQRGDQGLMTMLSEPSADDQFAAAFRAWGIDVDGVPTAEAAERFKGRPEAVVTEVVAALDEWAAERRQQHMPPTKAQRLADLAAALDKPDSTRQELREMLASGSLQRERALGALSVALRPVPVPIDAGLGDSRSRLRQLAAAADPAREPILGLLTLVRALRNAGEDALAERLLRIAVRARPREVALHFTLGQLLAGQRRWQQAVECYSAARAVRPESGVALATALVRSGRIDEGLTLLEHQISKQPDNPWLRAIRGTALFEQGRYEEAEAAYREQLRLNPQVHEPYNNIGSALLARGKLEKAEAAYREAIKLKPDFAQSYANLGFALRDQNKPEQAEAACRVAINLDPDHYRGHNNLGNALEDQGQLKKAEEAYRTALRLQPNHSDGYYNLGIVLRKQGKPNEAEEAYREALRLKPQDPEAYYNLGIALFAQGKLKEAEAANREAIRLRPGYVKAYNNLGLTLGKQGLSTEAEAALREVVRLKPEDYKAHYQIGFLLHERGQLTEAEAAYREALRHQPGFPQAHCELGKVLRDQGRFTEALQSLRDGDELGRMQANWPKQPAQWVSECERLVELDGKLTTVREGKAEPTNAAERLALASLCQMPCKGLHYCAARLATDAFAADPKLADDPRKGHRYKAACSAALAAAGRAMDATNIPDEVASKLRRQALGWLRADLALYAELVERDNPADKQNVRQAMLQWQKGADLASVRDRDALYILTGEDRTDWRRFWEEVDLLLWKVEARK